MSDQQPSEKLLFMKPTKPLVIILLLVLLAGAFAMRMIDFTDLPLEFGATRELHSFIMARGYYYEMQSAEKLGIDENIRDFGIGTGKSEPSIEPPIFEHLVAYTYVLNGHENMQIARFYSIIFWIIGGVGFFLLARKLLPLNGAFFALAFYLFNHFGAFYSRNFQPDPMMVMFIVWALYFQVLWAEKNNLSSTILAGLFTGLAILIKAPAVFFVGFTMVGLVIYKGILNSLKNWRVYLMAVLSIAPAVIYYTLSATVGGNAGSIFGARWFPSLFSDVQWYLGWLQLAKSVVGVFPFVLALAGFFFIPRKSSRVFYICMWIGYLIYGFVFAYHVYTHDYYHLPLIPTVAIGFGAVCGVLMQKLEESWKTWLPRALVLLLLAFSLALCVQRVRGVLVRDNYRHEAKYWQELGEKLRNASGVVALTHDYGYRLVYWGYVQPKLWPTEGDLNVKALMGSTDPAFEQNFKIRTEGADYFLVTLIDDFNSQKDLHDYLFAHYPYEQGDGYYIFDLKHPIG